MKITLKILSALVVPFLTQLRSQHISLGPITELQTIIFTILELRCGATSKGAMSQSSLTLRQFKVMVGMNRVFALWESWESSTFAIQLYLISLS